MPNNKKLSLNSIKGKQIAHPFSRKARQIRRVINRDGKLANQKVVRDETKQRIVDRLLFFKFAVPVEQMSVTTEQLHDAVVLYINRKEEDINRLKQEHQKRPPGRSKPSQLINLENLRDADQREYDTGIEVPDVTDPTALAMLRDWEGDYNGITHIKMVTVRNPKTMVKSGPDFVVKAAKPTSVDEEMDDE
ncbi:translation machinery-associated protein 16 [Polychytrium aggregatum]|uniref:translation machinery-associated protein 16 n=1 Tax=Polychytrium aggregatum TaxID=110093 RepID=UPI0022FEA962|nr:translation machinery-associated protein 16 [Polychytrium aggregatum]KAI9205239.1 translation machinery-associated protein 16 [Polychytrium aggregatum]